MKYVLDKIEEGIYVFIHDKTEKQLLLPKSAINSAVKEGDVVKIKKTTNHYDIEVLKK